MYCKRMRDQRTEATGSKSSRGEDELQGVALDLNFKLTRARRDRRDRQRKLERQRQTSGNGREDELQANIGADAADETNSTGARGEDELQGIAVSMNL